jgi:dipeptidyl aminopeptidase/acylaminoacyl peptidase
MLLEQKIMTSASKLNLVQPADLFRLQFVQSAAISHSGNFAAYTVSRSDIDANKEYVAIWIADLRSGETRQLTSGAAMDAAPAWSPDDKFIGFMSTRNEGKPQLFVIPVDGGEGRQVTTFKQGVGSGPSWSPDGKNLAFTAVPIEEPRDPSLPYRVTRFVYRSNNLEYLDDVKQDIYIIPVAGGDVRRITDDACMNVAPTWSPDGKELLYAASMFADIPDTLLPRLRIADLVSGQIRDLTGSWGYVYNAAWLPDGKHIAYVGVERGKPIGSKNDLWVVSSAGGKPECRTASLKPGVGGGLQPDMPVMGMTSTFPISSDGSSALVNAQIGGTEHIYRVALSGAEHWEAVVEGDRACMLMGAGDRQIVYMASDFQTPTDLYVCDIEGANEKRLTNLNSEWQASVSQPKVERLLFPGVDGVQVEGWIYTPPEGKAPYPTILYIHGGPHGAFGSTFHFDSQMLCGAGYAVLMVNHRASTGYDDAFSTAIKGDWGNLDYNDLMSGVDYAIVKGIADPDRLGVCGLSGGGNLSTWIVGQTDRFKAAVPENPVTNWVSFYGVSDIGVWFAVEELGGHPHEIPEIYAKCSPITYAHRCKTPTLMVQGEHDWRCPPEQSEQFYTVLKANGCTVEMLRFPNSAHGASIAGALPVRKAHNDALMDWMNRYVKGDKK